MNDGDCKRSDEATHIAQHEGDAVEDLDPEIQAAIERAEAQAARGEGIPLDEAFAKLRKKHFGE